MPAHHQTSRVRCYHWPCGGEATHGHFLEYFIGLTLVAASIMFVVGSYCFLTGNPKWITMLGDELYIAGSLIYLVTSLYSAVELSMSCCAYHQREVSEMFENILYIVAALIFTAGTVLFWPELWDGHGEQVALTCEIWGSYCFIIGSIGFCMASFFNALSLNRDAERAATIGNSTKKRDIVIAKRCHYLTISALFFSQLGGVLFVAGSYLYRPGFNNHCDPEKEALGTEEPESFCVNVLDEGTRLYIIGSFFYLAQSVLALIKIYLKHQISAEIGDSSDDEDGEE